jgi:serine kinase of HPr protein (carbohydrate metabolism regulator)
MSAANGATIHASCVLVGRAAVLIRGASGTGKSRLALALIEAGTNGTLPLTRLVADDRVKLTVAHGRLLASAPEAIKGKIEVRGDGVHDAACEPIALVKFVVDLGASDSARMPEATAREVEISGVSLSRLPVAAGEAALPAVLAAIAAVTDA